MAYLLRALILLMVFGVTLTILLAFHLVDIGLGHIQVAIPTYIYTIFAQAFVMFYFIGVSRLVDKVYITLHSEKELHLLFDDPPKDLKPYLEKAKKFSEDATRFKRQTIPWTMLMLILGMIGFLLGGAHDTGLVSKPVHSGVVYGFVAAMLIGFFRQWYYLGKGHLLLRKLKTLFSLPDHQM
jgi:hypothetical protein